MVRADHQVETKTTAESFKGKSKKVYPNMRRILIVKDRVIQLKTMDGMLKGNNVETAELLCSTFKEVFTMEDVEETNGNTMGGGW
jgi:hypothetical protein